MGTNNKAETLNVTKSAGSSDSGDDVLNEVGDALQTESSLLSDTESQQEADTIRDAPIELCDDDIVFNEDAADKIPDLSPSAASRRSNPPIVPHPSVIKLKQRISGIKRQSSVPPPNQTKKPRLKGIRDDHFVLFSAATLARIKGDFSTRTYQNDEEVADALLDLQKLSGTANDESDMDTRDEVMEAVLSLPPISEPPVQQLTKNRKGLKTAGILAVAVVSAVVGAGIYSRFSSHAGRDDTTAAEKNVRIAELQKKSDELETVLASANSESVESLKRQLNETRKELKLLKSMHLQKKESTPKENIKIDIASLAPGATPRKPPPSPAEPPTATKRASAVTRKTGADNAQKKDADELSYLLGAPTQPKAASGTATAASKPATQSETDEEILLLPNSLSRDDIRIGIRRILAKVRRCGNGKTASVNMDITINAEGRVTNATALAPFEDTPTGYCVSSVVRTAHFPKSQSGATIQYLFSLGLVEAKKPTAPSWAPASSSASSTADLDLLLTD